MQCAKIFQNAKYSVPLCAELVEKYKNDNIEVVSNLTDVYVNKYPHIDIELDKEYTESSCLDRSTNIGT